MNSYLNRLSEASYSRGQQPYCPAFNQHSIETFTQSVSSYEGAAGLALEGV